MDKLHLSTIKTNQLWCHNTVSTSNHHCNDGHVISVLFPLNIGHIGELSKSNRSESICNACLYLSSTVQTFVTCICICGKLTENLLFDVNLRHFYKLKVFAYWIKCMDVIKCKVSHEPFWYLHMYLLLLVDSEFDNNWKRCFILS